MSDVAIAPNTPPPAAPPAPAAPAAPVREVPVNPDPVSQPAPIGSQAPSRREVIQKAIAKGRQENPPKPREAKIGDNNPPEPIDREKPALNLRRRPDEQAPAPGQALPRGDHGHFAPRAQNGAQTRADGAQTGAVAQPGAQPAQQAPRHAQLPEGAPYREPLSRMHERAKADWAATPESVRGDIYRAQGEFNKAYQQYRHDHETMNTIRHFHEMASQQGTTLERALGNYVQMEQKLRQDPLGGFDLITHNLNLRAPDGTKLTFADLCYAYLNQSPEQQALIKGQNAAYAQQQQIGQLSNMVRTLASGIQRMQYNQQFTQTRGALDRYAESHPRFDELGDLIEQEIKHGYTLDQAYSRAALLRPATAATQAAQTRTPTAQTRTATGKSISGAPAGPSNGTGRPGKPVGRRDAIRNAIKQASGAL
jgi:hypothetical protein